MRKFASIVPVLLVAVTSVLGLIQIPDEFRNDRESLLQMSVAVGATLHSVLGTLCVIAVLMRKRWAVALAVLWTAAVTYTASVASVAFVAERDTGVIVGAVAAGIACVLLGWWVTWAAKEFAARSSESGAEPSPTPNSQPRIPTNFNR